MSDLLTVRNRIKADHFLNDSEYDSRIDDAIRTTLANLEFDKWWFLERVGSLTLTTGTTTITLANDVGAINFIDFSDSADRYRLQDMTYKQLTDTYYNNVPLPTDKPYAYALVYRTLYFSHTARATYTLPYMYYARDAVLPTANSDTSIWFGREGINLIKTQASLLFATEVLKDDAFSPLPAQAAKITMNERQRKIRRY